MEFDAKTGPFVIGFRARLDRLSSGGLGSPFSVDANSTKPAALFPKPIPESPFPPPQGFDHPRPPNPTELSANALTRVASALRLLEPDAEPTLARVQSASIRQIFILDQFKTWADNVAVPLFDALTQKLRSAGQHARIERRSGAPGDRAGFEIVGLRVQLANRIVAYLRVSAHEYRPTQVELEIHPPPTGDRYSTGRLSPELSELTAARLEQEALSLLERAAAPIR